VSEEQNKLFLERVSALPNFDCTEEMAALAGKHADGSSLVQAAIDEKILSKEDACRCWADTMGIAYVDPFASVITDEAIARIPVAIATKAKAIGLYILDGVLTVALADPSDSKLVRRIGQVAEIPVSPVFALQQDIEAAISINYSQEKGLEQSLSELANSDLFSNPETAAERVVDLAEDNGLAGVLDAIIYFAMRERASDIHIEPMESLCRIRFRIDGNLREVLTYSRKLHRALISRIKILCELNISEMRYPQDGRFTMPIGSQSANFRVSTLAADYGEKAVIRILAMSGKKTMLTLDKMMISQSILGPFKQLIRNPNGIIFVTGPTGSGKTTTLYAALNEINSPALNISTIEDPIEIKLAGVTQSQVNSHIDLKFATILRTLMRQDPDAILIGEIRDLETAKIATEAALTGHIVFATLHTNTAPQAIVRLIEIGVEPYMVAPTVIGVLGQRLAARICEGCKEAYHPPIEVLQRYFKDESFDEVTFYRGRGCPACRQTGYKGRVAFHELILITDEVRRLISENRSVQDIAHAAEKIGYRPLRYDGLKKVLLGLTTVDEIEQSTSFEWAS
jgi:type II secretory ATPase GspE/PulE/Tfp pilus assembly ATPase PilB-like protein